MSADRATVVGREQLPPRVATALAVADIPPSKRGAARRARLTETEREVVLQDPLSGDGVRARVAPDGVAEWWPESAVVVAGVLDTQGDSCACCCPVLNLFAYTGNAERWLAAHPEVRGDVISMREAILAGKPSSAT